MKRKRLLLPSFFVLLFLLTLIFCVTVQAAQTVNISFDGVRIPVSQAPGVPPADGSAYPPFYLDVAAETANNRTFVPLRLVSELLGAEVDWQAPNVFMTYNNTTVKLVIGSKQASKNKTTVMLDAAPYIKGDRIMVPIRFISESFNCQVNYAKALVNIKTIPLVIGDKQATKMTKTNKSPERINIIELKANLFIKNIYQTVFQNHGPQVEEPEHYGDNVNSDLVVYYWSGNDTFSLFDANKNEIGQFTIYEATGNGLPHPEGTPKYLLYDGTAKKWYSLPKAAYALMQRWNWTATRYGAADYDTAWHLIKQ